MGDMTADAIRVRFVQDCPMKPGIRLGRHRSKSSLLTALQDLQYTPKNTSQLIQDMLEMQDTLQEDQNMLQAHRKKVGVYLTDGSSGDLRGTLDAAFRAKEQSGVRMFGVGVGDLVDKTELQGLVSCRLEDHLHIVSQPEGLRDIRRKLITQICRGTDV